MFLFNANFASYHVMNLFLLGTQPLMEQVIHYYYFTATVGFLLVFPL